MSPPVELVACGSYGYVYRCDLRNEAVKVGRTDVPKAAESIWREVDSLQRLKSYGHHNNIIGLLGVDFGGEEVDNEQSGGLLKLRMELMPCSLMDVLDFMRGPTRSPLCTSSPPPLSLRSLSERVRVLQGIAGGLAFCHRWGCVHRDIKPANILLKSGTGPGGVVPKICDFGSALWTLEEREEFSDPFPCAGTSQYACPCHRAVVPSCSLPSCDMYGWGIVGLQTLLLADVSDVVSGLGKRVESTKLDWEIEEAVLKSCGSFEDFPPEFVVKNVVGLVNSGAYWHDSYRPSADVASRRLAGVLNAAKNLGGRPKEAEAE